MELRRAHHGHPRLRSLVVAGAAGVMTLSVAVSAQPAGATTAPTVPGDETTTPDDSPTTTEAAAPTSAEPTTTAAAAPTTTAAGATTTGPATASSAEFTATLEAECEGDTGHQLLASGLQVVMGEDGSLRVIEIVLACDIEFVGAVDEALGRPTTNIEALIADPANNVTPSQAQTDLLNEELAGYWRTADAWAQSQAGAAPDDDATATTAAEEATPSTDATASSAPEEPATTTG
jgi:hypothetical protein